jgi:hypothetical protein
MADDQNCPPLARRVPGATRAAPGGSERPVLSEDLLQRMQAVVSAAHAQAAEEQRIENEEEARRAQAARPDQVPHAPPSRRLWGAGNGRRLPFAAAMATGRPAGWSDADDDTSPIPRLSASGAVAATSPESGVRAEPDRARKQDRRDRQAAKQQRERAAKRERERAAERERQRAAERERTAELERERAAEEERQRTEERTRERARQERERARQERERAAEEERRRAAERERAAELERERAAERERQRAAEREWEQRRPPAARTAADLLEQPRSRVLAGSRRFHPSTLVAAAVVVVAAGSLAVVLSSHGAKPASAARGRRTAPATLAAAWAARQVSRTAVVGCDPAMCNALRARGLDHLLILGSPGADPLHSQVIIATAAVRKDLGARLGSVYAPDILASFGGGAARVDVRMVAPDGVTAYRAALATDLQNRKQAGGYLLSSSRVTASTSARRQMLGGQVTSQLLIVITNLASLHPVDIVTFGDSGPGASPDMPLRSAELAETGGAAAVRSMLAFLHAQKPPYLPAITETIRLGGKPILLIEFAAPTPLGLLGS